MTEEERKAQGQRVQTLANQLGEHFDHVMVFVSKTEDGHTFSCHRGCGSWMGRYGQVREWVVYEEERIRAQAREQHAHERLKENP